MPFLWLLFKLLNEYGRIMFLNVGVFWGILILIFVVTPTGCVMVLYYQKMFRYIYKKWNL